MLILLPPSEGKCAPAAGAPVALDDLRFPALNEQRERMLKALTEASAAPDAIEQLQVSVGLAEQVASNVSLRQAAAGPAIDVYAGVLFDAMEYHRLEPMAQKMVNESVLISSALWGLVAPDDRIPAYRFSSTARLRGMGTVASGWKKHLTPVLNKRAENQVVVDCRSSGYAAMWKPQGALADSTAQIKVLQVVGGKRSVVSHHAKYTRGLVTRYLAEHLAAGAVEPRTVAELRDVLAMRWAVELQPQTKPGTPRVLNVIEE